MIRHHALRGIIFLIVCFISIPASAATNQQIENAIKRGIDYLYSRQKNGNWEESPMPNPNGDDADVKGKQWGGLTAVATYALLAAGQDTKDPRLQQAITFLKEAPMIGTYALGMRAQIWHFLPRDPMRRALAQRDARLLLAGVKSEGRARGMFNYYADGKPGDRYDHSCSNYGVLGLWAAADNELELPPQIWALFEDSWRRHEYPDGSWAYEFKPEDMSKWEAKGTMSMTAAGVATLFITQDQLHSMDGLKCEGSLFDPFIARGIQWMAKNFDLFKSFRTYYTLYNVSRVGVASGHKYFDTVNWYQQGLDYIMSHQRGDGSWDQGCGPIPDTCFAILFLVRGRAPVIINKLEYTVDRAGDNPKPATWNQRPRDIANLTRWIAKQMERDLNWQIVNLKAPVEELHDAPILFISGSEALNFSKEDQAKLKQFVEQGGLILGHSDCSKLAFTESFKRLGKALFPTYEFRELPATHCIYTEEQYQRKSWRTPPLVLGMSNGARELMLLIPIADPGKSWQTRSFEGASRLPVSQLAANIFQYTIEKQGLRYKGETHIILPNPKITPDKTIKVARLQYAGNWDPEPGGWRRLAAVMQNTYGVKVETQDVKLGSKLLKKDFAVAHLTGTAKFRLDTAARAELRQYIADGGTLIVDSCGGSADFNTAATAELKAIWNAAPVALKKDDAVYSAVEPAITEVGYRMYAGKLIPRGTKVPRLMGIDLNGRTAIYVSHEDLSTGLVGQSVDGIIGYTPQSATQLMSYMLLKAGNVKISAEDMKKIAEQGK